MENLEDFRYHLSEEGKIDASMAAKRITDSYGTKEPTSRDKGIRTTIRQNRAHKGIAPSHQLLSSTTSWRRQPSGRSKKRQFGKRYK